MTTIEVWVERPEPRLLNFECELSPDGHTVPRLTRHNISQLIYWLWEFDPEAGPEKDGSTIPYLLDDAMLLLGGGIFSIQYPTDHGKSTLVDVDTVASLLLWPEETLNIVIKRAVEAAVKSAQDCAFKLQRASEYFPYARPLVRWDVQTGLPQVKSGYFIEGCRLRQVGTRDRSVFPAGIGSASVQGNRGRAKLDDLEDENTLKSEARADTLRKQVNNSVRNLQRIKKNSPHMASLWAVFGTPQGANSIMFVVDSELQSSGLRFHVIRRPRVIEDGPYKGQLLFPATEVKAAMQAEVMDPAAYDIAYNLRVPGEGRFDHKLAQKYILDSGFPLMQNEIQLREYLYERLIEDGRRHVGLQYTSDTHLYREAQRMVEEELAIYGEWDPATVGTYAIALLAMLPQTRWLLRFELASADSNEQADKLLEWQYLFPNVMHVVERDGQQDAFIDILRLKDPAAMVIPHTTHGFNKNTRHVGIPSMMQEMLVPNKWHFPWVPEDYCRDYLGGLLKEIQRWGPTSHPHGIPCLWFGWYFDKQSRVERDSEQRQRQGPPDSNQAAVFDVVLSDRRPLQDIVSTMPNPERSDSQESWDRRWPSLDHW